MDTIPSTVCRDACAQSYMLGRVCAYAVRHVQVHALDSGPDQSWMPPLRLLQLPESASPVKKLLLDLRRTPPPAQEHA